MIVDLALLNANVGAVDLAQHRVVDHLEQRVGVRADRTATGIDQRRDHDAPRG
jgi:hypothetical protein